MSALLLAILRILGALWGFLVDLMPVLGKLGPWLVATFPFLNTFLRESAARFGADAAEATLRGVGSFVFRTALLTAWAVFLGVVFTGINGLGIREICMGNPFSGFPAAMMFLVVSCFPVKFAFALAQAYIVWKFTFARAVLYMSRTMMFLFGP